MAFYIHASLYEVKTNLSAFIRALERGATDCVVIRRYGRNIAYINPFNRVDDPPLVPESDADKAMWRRAKFFEDGGRKSRRGG